ncbi:hypothetical protein BG011_001725 [Mortierella polycephala]|uniref:Uncharacterized protein n=1 Tax=Mortierella polycephala TaxID=41804 RepID=A0A9P6Q876_9FUNG|nr:hypothetical protein BG011_001725 [Mortierella polycephala]
MHLQQPDSWSSTSGDLDYDSDELQYPSDSELPSYETDPNDPSTSHPSSRASSRPTTPHHHEQDQPSDHPFIHQDFTVAPLLHQNMDIVTKDTDSKTDSEHDDFLLVEPAEDTADEHDVSRQQVESWLSSDQPSPLHESEPSLVDLSEPSLLQDHTDTDARPRSSDDECDTFSLEDDILPGPGRASGATPPQTDELPVTKQESPSSSSDISVPALPTPPSPTSDGHVLRIMITGGFTKQQAEYSTITDKITENLLRHNNAPITTTTSNLQFFQSSSDTTDKSQEDNMDLYVYVLPVTGVREQDAYTLVQIARVHPLLTIVSADDFLNPFTVIDARNELVKLLHQIRTSRDTQDYERLVDTILRSYVSIQDLSSVDIQGIIDRRPLVLTSPFSRPTLDFENTYRLLTGPLRAHVNSILGAALFSVIIFVGILACANHIKDSASQPSHAVAQRIGFINNGRIGVAHLDLYTAKGATFKGKELHAFHVRILDIDKPLSIEGAPSKDHVNIAAPIVQDLGNGTYRIYISSHHRRHHDPAMSLHSRLCTNKPRYFLHVWFQNGTRVPGTPLDLMWPKTKGVAPKHHSAPKGTPQGTSVKGDGSEGPQSGCPPGVLFEKDTVYDGEDIGSDDDGDDGSVFESWRQRLDQTPGPISTWLASTTIPWLSEYWHRIEPMVCNLHKLTLEAIAYALEASDRVARMISAHFDSAFGTHNFLYSQGSAAFKRAQYNARQIKAKTATKLSKAHQTVLQQQADAAASVSQDVMIALDQRIDSLRKLVRNISSRSAQLPTAERVFQQADRILVKVEDRVGDLLQSKSAKRVAQYLQGDQVIKKADQILMAAECQMAKIMDQFAQHVSEPARVREFKRGSHKDRLFHHLQRIKDGSDQKWKQMKRRYACAGNR